MPLIATDCHWVPQSHDGGFVEIHCKQGTGTIVGATVVAANAGDMISEITLAMQAGVGLDVVARVIHPYPTAAEGVMQAGLGYIRKHWAKYGQGCSDETR